MPPNYNGSQQPKHPYRGPTHPKSQGQWPFENAMLRHGVPRVGVLWVDSKPLPQQHFKLDSQSSQYKRQPDHPLTRTGSQELHQRTPHLHRVNICQAQLHMPPPWLGKRWVCHNEQEACQAPTPVPGVQQHHKCIAW